MSINAIVFDFGGVISPRPFFLSMAQVISPVLNVPESLIVQAFRDNAPGVLRGLVSSEVFWDRIASQIGHPLSVTLRHMALEAGYEVHWPVLELVASLKRSYRTFVLSDNIADIVDQVRPVLHPYFEAQFYSCDAGLTKHETEFFALFLKKTGLSPAQCFFIDDKQGNVLRARAVGFEAYAFRGLEDLRSELMARDLLSPLRLV